MAIVFISPKKRQRIFLWTIVAISAVVLMVIYLIVFPPLKNWFNAVSPETFTMPDVRISFATIDSDKFKSLEPFGAIAISFDYVAQDKSGKTVTGQISATSQEDAAAQLAAMGYTVSSLKEASSSSGRSEPFVPYSSSSLAPTSTSNLKTGIIKK